MLVINIYTDRWELIFRTLPLEALVQMIENIAAHDPDQLVCVRGCSEENYNDMRIIKTGNFRSAEQPDTLRFSGYSGTCES